MKRFFTLCVMLFVIVAAPQKATSQVAPIYNFSNAVLVSGTANTTGAVYRFSNVYTNTDALVTVAGMSSGITLRSIDRTADGYSEAFQPEYRISGSTNGYIDFTIVFVNAGTSTAVTQPIVSATGLDIDGSINGGASLYEFNRIDMGGGTYEYNTYNSQIVVSQTGTAITGLNTTGVLFGALVDTVAKEVMFSVTATSLSTMTYRVGADNQTSSTSTRYASLYYKKFTYQHFPLAISNLVSFDGTVANNIVKLNWEFAVANNYKNVVLERSNTSSNFSEIMIYSLYGTENEDSKFSYSDNSLSGDMVFYRLKATDMSGKVEYSNILSFRMNADTKKELKVYPSVVSSYTTVNINVAERKGAVLQVTDISGRMVKQQHVMLNAGTNSITLNGFDRFLKGNYIVSVKTIDGVLSRQVVVQ